MRRRNVALLLALVPGAGAAQTLAPEQGLQTQCRANFTVVSPDGTRLAVACRDKTLRLFALPAGRLVATLDRAASGINWLAYSRDGRRLGLAGAAGAVLVLDGRTGVALQEVNVGSVRVDTLALSPDGRRLAVGFADRPGQLWDLEKRTRLAELRPEFGGVMALAFSPDGRLLASADSDTRVRVYDAVTGALRLAFQELLLAPFALDFTPGSDRLLLGGADKTLVAIDAATGRALHRSPRQPDIVGGLLALADGKRALAYFIDPVDLQLTRVAAWQIDDDGLTVLTTDRSFNGWGGQQAARALLTAAEAQTLKLWSLP